MFMTKKSRYRRHQEEKARRRERLELDNQNTLNQLTMSLFEKDMQIQALQQQLKKVSMVAHDAMNNSVSNNMTSNSATDVSSMESMMQDMAKAAAKK